VIVRDGAVIPKERVAVESPRGQGINAASMEMEEETVESSPVDVAPPEIALEPTIEPAVEPASVDDLLAEPTPSVEPVEDLEPPLDLPEDAGDLFDIPAPASDDAGNLFDDFVPAGDGAGNLFDDPAPAGA